MSLEVSSILKFVKFRKRESYLKEELCLSIVRVNGEYGQAARANTKTITVDHYSVGAVAWVGNARRVVN